MLLHSVIYVFVVTAWHADVICSESIVEGCTKSLTLGKEGKASSFSASSFLPGYNASWARTDSVGAWIPKLHHKLNTTNPDFLQVDLGNERTITAIETERFGGYFITKFKVLLSNDGKKFSLLQTGDTNEFIAKTRYVTMNYLHCPVKARYVRIVPTGFHQHLALKVDIHGCDKNFKLKNEMRNLKLVARASREITVSWKTCSNFTHQSISYTPMGGELMHKRLDYAGTSNHLERIVNLAPCTQYKIDVEMITKNITHLQSLNVTTLPGKGPRKPTIVSYDSPKPFTAVIKWKPPNSTTIECRSKLIGYRVEYQPVGKAGSKQLFVHSRDTEVQIQELRPWLKYEFKVFSVGEYVNGTDPARTEIDIDGKAPEQPVTITSLRSQTPDSFVIKWENPPPNSVNGHIKNYAVSFRKKGTTDWKVLGTTLRSYTVKPLTSGETYQVAVTLYNEKYGKSTEIREIFVGRKGPFESTELTSSFYVTSPSTHIRGILVSWNIPRTLQAETPESILVQVRELGRASWKEQTTSATTNALTFRNLLPFLVYECMLTLNTTKGTYYTKKKMVLVTGTSSDASELLKITSLVSQPGKAIITVKIPEQFLNYTNSAIVVRCMIKGSRSHAKSFYIHFKAPEQTFVISGLEPWHYWIFYLGARIKYTTKEEKLVYSRRKELFVVGYSPGKAPTDVRAEALFTTQIKVSWTKIARRYIVGNLAEYVVFYSAENATLPQKTSASGSSDSTILMALEPDTTYSIQVAGLNETRGIGPLSAVATARTFEDPRTPVAISVTPVSDTEIVFKWKQPIEPGQKTASFILQYTILHIHRKIVERNITKSIANVYTEKIDGLMPATRYSIFISAFKIVNGVVKQSRNSSFLISRTFSVPPPPVPRLVSTTPISPYAINVRWRSKVDVKSNWLNFTVTAADKRGNSIRQFLHALQTDMDPGKEKEFSLTLGSLEPFRSYRGHVIGVKRKLGIEVKSEASNEFKVKTLEAAPSAPLKFKIQGRKEFPDFRWKSPRTPNGRVRSYILEIYDSTDGQLVFNRTIISKGSFTLRSTLKYYHTYLAKLRAVTVKPGPAAEKTFRTAEGRPSSPSLATPTFNGTHLSLTWKSPTEPNGRILRYKIEFGKMTSNAKVKIDSTNFISGSRRTFTKIETSYGSLVVVRVAGETLAGVGNFSDQIVRIDRSLRPKPKAPPLPVVNKDAVQPNTIVIKLKQLAEVPFSFKLSSYQVIVEKVNGGSLQRRAVNSFPKMIANYSIAVKNGDRYYIAAEFKAANLPEEFVVGDGKTYNGYQNARLIPGTVYAVHVRAIAVDRNGDQVYGSLSSLRLPATAPRKSVKKSGGGLSLPVIAAIAGSLLLLIVLVVIIILYLRGSARRRQPKNRKESLDMELAKLRTQVDPDEQRPVSLTGDFPLYPDHPPITMANYNNHVSKMLRNKSSGFRCEYNQLEMGKEYSWEIAHLPENKPKNRFANIVAYDHARVILGRISGLVGSDYINASYIDGYMKPNAYVASQGPLPGTFNDFWRMIWELRSSVIVMLTNLQEKNKLKCHKYWPDDCIEYGEIVVTQTRKEVYADYIIRTFLLDRTDSPESREVKHFHFTVWPDHGVPKYATALLAFRRRVRSYNGPDAGPTIVHCSAGVGRTGTYIALDASLDRLNVNGDVDVFNFIAAMRTRRIAMVQTEEQYIFIHNAILESVQCGNTEITAQDLRIMINKLEQLSADTKMSGFEREWKILNNVSPIPSKSSCNIAALSDNMPKNRSQNACILPADNSLVRLFTIEDDESTSYINAVYVDGYKQRDAFILAQAPLKNTICDFWRMLCEHKSASVVLLCSMDEGEDFEKFWPEMHIKEYEMITVEYLSKTRGSDEMSMRNSVRHGETNLICRQFRVEDSRFPEHPMMVKLFQYVGWTENKVPNTFTHVIQLISLLERWQQQSGNGPVTIVCSDGIGRSGTFAALNAVLERVKVEQVVDVFQAIKAMRIQRAHLVKTLDQYRFIYNAVEGYLEAFDDYANFK